MNDWAVVVTGLPASGKSTVGRALAKELSWSCLDKDDFLEALFDEQGVGDEQWRRRLSVEADERFERAALKQCNVVLVSHWSPAERTNTGTPTNWVNQRFANTAEVYCECEPDLAARRFIERNRHVGHQDDRRAPEDILIWMHEFAMCYPIHMGSVIRVSTMNEVSIQKVADEIRQLRI